MAFTYPLIAEAHASIGQSDKRESVAFVSDDSEASMPEGTASAVMWDLGANMWWLDGPKRQYSAWRHGAPAAGRSRNRRM